MISGQAWEMFLDMLANLYTWADSKIIVDFAGYQLSFVDLWMSACVIIISFEAILTPVFGGRAFYVTSQNKEGNNQ